MPTGPDVNHETLIGSAAPVYQFYGDDPDRVIVDVRGRRYEPNREGRVRFDLFPMTGAAAEACLQQTLEQFPYADSVLVIREEGDPATELRRNVVVTYFQSEVPPPTPPAPPSQDVPSRFDRDLP